MGITEITGVIAVVVSVLYLGLQIRDNTKVLRSQAHYNALSLAQRPMEMMIENESLANVVNRSYSDPDAISADDWASTNCTSTLWPGRRRLTMPLESVAWMDTARIPGAMPSPAPAPDVRDARRDGRTGSFSCIDETSV